MIRIARVRLKHPASFRNLDKWWCYRVWRQVVIENAEKILADFERINLDDWVRTK